MLFCFFFFFFSSRRRHTRFDCDWSSDVCSSDLSDLFVIYTVGQQFASLVAANPAQYTQNRFAIKYTDRKSTRLNSSHSQISYAVFCLKKKKINNITPTTMPETDAPDIELHRVDP